MTDEFSHELDEALDMATSVEKSEQNCGYASTGCTVLDLSIANKFPGGVPIGRITHIFGAESTAKTVLGMTILGSIQRQKGVAFFADVENTFDPEWAELFGLNCEDKDAWRLGFWEDKKSEYLRQPSTVEEFFDEYVASIVALEDDRAKVVVIDSLSAMPSAVEIKDELVKGTYGATRAKAMSSGFRKYMSSIAQANLSLVFINQARDNVGVIFGPKEVVSGGRALNFYSSVVIHLLSGEKIKNAREQDIGVWLNFRIDKNKVGPPYRSGKFAIIWEYGLDNVLTNLAYLKDCQAILAKEGKGKKERMVEFNGEKKYMSRMVSYVEKNELEQKLDEDVIKMWLEMYKPSDRKRRIWK